MAVLPLMRAIMFAAHEYKERRKNDEVSPYLNHPLAVVYKLVEHGVRDDDILMAAALHGVIAECHTSPDEIEARFGRNVLNYVFEVTDDHLLSKEERIRLQIHHAPTLSPGAKLIKIADKICNMTDLVFVPPAGWDAESIRNYAHWSVECMKGYRSNQFPMLEKEFDSTVLALIEHVDGTDVILPAKEME